MPEETINPEEKLQAEETPGSFIGLLPGNRSLEDKADSPSGKFPGTGVFSLPQMLVESGLMSWDQINDAQRTARREKLPLADILVRDGLVLSLQLATLSALNLGLNMVDLGSQDIDPAAVALLPEEIARKYSVLPIKKVDGRITVAMTDPTDLQLIHDLSSRTGATIHPVTAVRKDILEHIDVAYRLSRQRED